MIHFICTGRIMFFVIFFLFSIFFVSRSQLDSNKGNSAALWNREYSTSSWKYLEQYPSEKARFALIAGLYFQLFCAPHSSKTEFSNHSESVFRQPSFLDLGCGEGIMSDFLNPKQRKRYTGVDISEVAISNARINRPFSTFFVSKIEDFNPPNITIGTTSHQMKYDMISFSEVLYYTDHVKMVEKFLQYLAPGGYFCISIWESSSVQQYWDTVLSHTSHLIRERDVLSLQGTSKHGKKVGWKIGIFSPVQI